MYQSATWCRILSILWHRIVRCAHKPRSMGRSCRPLPMTGPGAGDPPGEPRCRARRSQRPSAVASVLGLADRCGWAQPPNHVTPPPSCYWGRPPGPVRAVLGVTDRIGMASGPAEEGTCTREGRGTPGQVGGVPASTGCWTRATCCTTTPTGPRSKHCVEHIMALALQT